MRTSPIAFEFTSQMRDWIYATHFDGPTMCYDRWTWGLTLIEPSKHAGIGNYKSLSYCQHLSVQSNLSK